MEALIAWQLLLAHRKPQRVNDLLVKMRSERVPVNQPSRLVFGEEAGPAVVAALHDVLRHCVHVHAWAARHQIDG